MIPLNTNPFKNDAPEWLTKAVDEIEEFVRHECECAELPLFEDITTLPSNAERYKKACRVLHINNVTIRTHKGTIVAVKG